MIAKSFLSRRELVAALAIPPTAPLTACETKKTTSDTELIALGHEFDKITAQIDNAIDQKLDLEEDVIDHLGRIDGEITTMQAQTIEELRVKARAACWALLGDLDPSNQLSTDQRMALSIVRDLIRLYDSSLERPGALKKVVADLD